MSDHGGNCTVRKIVLFSSRLIISVIRSRRIGLIEIIARMEYIRNSYNILVGKTKGKNPLGRRMHKWEDNTYMRSK
jgi:hypothetical protein